MSKRNTRVIPMTPDERFEHGKLIPVEEFDMVAEMAANTTHPENEDAMNTIDTNDTTVEPANDTDTKTTTTIPIPVAVGVMAAIGLTIGLGGFWLGKKMASGGGEIADTASDTVNGFSGFSGF